MSSLSGVRGLAQQNGEDEVKSLLSQMVERWDCFFLVCVSFDGLIKVGRTDFLRLS